MTASTRRSGQSAFPRLRASLAVVLGCVLAWALLAEGTLMWAPAVSAQQVAAADEFHPVNPTLVMDTRVGLGGAKFAPGEARALTVAGNAGLPASGVTAVALNVTVTNPTTQSYLAVWPAGLTNPGTSNLNFAAGETRANAVVSGVSAGGQLTIFNAVGTTDVVVDVTGWWSAGFVGVTPARLLDTRTTRRFGPGAGRLDIAGRGGVPASGAQAVALTITVTNPAGAGFVAVWPDDAPTPGTSNVNFATGDTVAATAIVTLGSDGGISLLVAGGPADIIIDVMGWFSGGWGPITPARLLDTRDGTGRCGLYMMPSETRTITIAGRAGVPESGVGAAALNVTVTAPTDAPGFVTIWPAGSPQPLASNLNFRPGQTVANAVLVGVGSGGQVSFYNGGGPTELIVDVTGYFTGTTPSGTPAPCPPLTTTSEVPLPGRRMPDGTIATAAFNATVSALGPSAAVTKSPLRMALALVGPISVVDVRSSQFDEGAFVDVVFDERMRLDDSVAGVHVETRLLRLDDGTYRVTSARWGYNCRRRPSPPYSPELCP